MDRLVPGLTMAITRALHTASRVAETKMSWFSRVACRAADGADRVVVNKRLLEGAVSEEIFRANE